MSISLNNVSSEVIRAHSRIDQLGGNFIFLKRTKPSKGETFQMPQSAKEVVFFTSTTNSYDFMYTYLSLDTIAHIRTNYEPRYRLICNSLAYGNATGRHMVCMKMTNSSTFVVDQVDGTVGYIYCYYR